MVICGGCLNTADVRGWVSSEFSVGSPFLNNTGWTAGYGALGGLAGFGNGPAHVDQDPDCMCRLCVGLRELARIQAMREQWTGAQIRPQLKSVVQLMTRNRFIVRRYRPQEDSLVMLGKCMKSLSLAKALAGWQHFGPLPGSRQARRFNEDTVACMYGFEFLNWPMDLQDTFMLSKFRHRADALLSRLTVAVLADGYDGDAAINCVKDMRQLVMETARTRNHQAGAWTLMSVERIKVLLNCHEKDMAAKAKATKVTKVTKGTKRPRIANK